MRHDTTLPPETSDDGENDRPIGRASQRQEKAWLEALTTRKRVPSVLIGTWRAARSMLIGVAVVAATWELIFIIWDPPSYIFPSLNSVANVLYTQWDILLRHAWITGYEVLIGFFCAVTFGLLSGTLLHVLPRLGKVAWPAVLFSQLVPKVAFSPLLLAIFGFGIAPKIVIAFLIAFFPVLIGAYAGFRSIAEETKDLALSMKMDRWSYFRLFEFPHALPNILSGMKVAVTLAVVGTIVAEFVGADAGLGYLIIVAAGTVRQPLMLASLIVLSVLGLVLYRAAETVERMLVPWHVSQRRSQTEEMVSTARSSVSMTEGGD